MVAVEQHTNYHRELQSGDVSPFAPPFSKQETKSLRFIHEMRDDETGEVAATCALVGVHLDATVRKALSLPSEVRERAVLMIGEGAALIEARR
jgi:acyl-CoA thioester hydrolase